MRLTAYLGERFPPGPYTVLVALFHGAASLAAVRLGGGDVRWWAGIVVWLAFFHLRVFDEHKDYDKDLIAHPERLLSRGVVTLRMLKWWGGLAIVGESAIALAIGGHAFAWWAAMFAFTVAMRFEFGVGRWLNEHIVTYALTHNPAVGLLAMFSWASTGAKWHRDFGIFVLAVSLGSVALEIGRKTRLPAEELPTVPSYSSVHGRRLAGSMVFAAVAGAGACGILLDRALTSAVPPTWTPLYPLLGGVLIARAMMGENKRAKSMENGASLALVGLLVSVGIAAW